MLVIEFNLLKKFCNLKLSLSLIKYSSIFCCRWKQSCSWLSKLPLAVILLTLVEWNRSTQPNAYGCLALNSSIFFCFSSSRKEMFYFKNKIKTFKTKTIYFLSLNCRIFRKKNIHTTLTLISIWFVLLKKCSKIDPLYIIIS